MGSQSHLLRQEGLFFILNYQIISVRRTGGGGRAVDLFFFRDGRRPKVRFISKAIAKFAKNPVCETIDHERVYLSATVRVQVQFDMKSNETHHVLRFFLN